MSILFVYWLLVILACAAIAAGLAMGRRSSAIVWSLAVVACFLIGALWQEIALRNFASHAPGGMKGLIIRPVPYAGGDHEFTPHGEHYARYAFVIPGVTAFGLALIVGLVGVAMSRPASAAAASIALAIFGGALGYVLLAVARLIAASEIFI